MRDTGRVNGSSDGEDGMRTAAFARDGDAGSVYGRRRSE